MSSTPEDLLAKRIVAHLGKTPEVPPYVAQQLVRARAVAVTRLRRTREPVWLGTVAAMRTWGMVKSRIMLGLATAALVAGYCVTLASQHSSEDVYAWHAEDDSSHYAELLQD